MATPPKQRPEGFDPANDHESRASTVISIAVTFAALSSIFTGLRLYARLRILRIFCTDDGAILLTQVGDRTRWTRPGCCWRDDAGWVLTGCRLYR